MSAVRLRVVVVSHRGHVREQNEDAVGLAGWVLRTETGVPLTSIRAAPLEVLVADGMGGHAGGSTASLLAVGAFGSASGSVAERLAAADRALAERVATEPSLRGMGTTLAGAAIEVDGSVRTFGVGDSRVYRQVDGYLGRLTIDDRAPGTGGLLQHLGAVRSAPLDPHEARFTAAPGDRLLLCTDGVHDVLDDDALCDLLAGGPVTAIRDAVLDAGAPDNLSYVVVDVLPPVQ